MGDPAGKLVLTESTNMPPDSVSLPHIAQAHSSNKFVQGHRSTRPLATRRDKRDATLSGTGPPMKDEESVSSGGTEAKDVRDYGAGDLIKRISQTDVDMLRASSSQSSGSLDDPGSSAIPERTLSRDSELWFDDGNLVLVAGDVQFCVYKGLLTSQSAVFKDMLSLPQPISDDVNAHDDLSQSRACVHLSDSPEDVRHFLRAFTNGKLRYVTGHQRHRSTQQTLTMNLTQGRARLQRGLRLHPPRPQVPVRLRRPELHRVPQEVLR